LGKNSNLKVSDFKAAYTGMSHGLAEGMKTSEAVVAAKPGERPSGALARQVGEVTPPPNRNVNTFYP
jgi:hypothetical protein